MVLTVSTVSVASRCAGPRSDASILETVTGE